MLNTERAPIEEHLAQRRSFILEWTNKAKGNSDQLVFTQISRIDLSIRSKWTDLYRENVPEGVTFARCMKKVASSAEQLWTTDLSRDMQPPWTPKPTKGAGKLDKFAKQAAAASRKQRGAGRRGATSKSERKGGGKGTGKTGKSVKLGQAATFSNQKVKTARSIGTKVFCSSSTRKDAQREQNAYTSTNATC